MSPDVIKGHETRHPGMGIINAYSNIILANRVMAVMIIATETNWANCHNMGTSVVKEVINTQIGPIAIIWGLV